MGSRGPTQIYTELRILLDSLELYETWLVTPDSTIPHPKNMKYMSTWYRARGAHDMRVISLRAGTLFVRVK